MLIEKKEAYNVFFLGTSGTFLSKSPLPILPRDVMFGVKLIVCFILLVFYNDM